MVARLQGLAVLNALIDEKAKTTVCVISALLNMYPYLENLIIVNKFTQKVIKSKLNKFT